MAMAMYVGSFVRFHVSVITMSHTNAGCRYSAYMCGCSVQTTGQRAKTRMNEPRYRISGISQKSGIGDRSVVMCVVMPSIKLDGIAASMTQRKRRPAVISSEARWGVSVCVLALGVFG